MPDQTYAVALETMRLGNDETLRLFSVGPFGNRVSFAFQQRRALSLVSGIAEKYGSENDQKIAVLGARLIQN